MFTGISFAGQRDKNKRRHNDGYALKYKGDNHRGNYRRNNGDRHYKNGYRYKYRGHRKYQPKHYRGHWNSWKSWDDHYRYNRNLYRHGRYYRNNGSLYFGFETDEGFFGFSIGR